MQEKNEFYFIKLQEQINKPITVGYIYTTDSDCIVNEFSNILESLDGHMGLRIDGPGLYRMHTFISKDFTVVYIKDKDGNIIYRNDMVQEMCPREYNLDSVAELIKASFGEEASEAYIREKKEYWEMVRSLFANDDEDKRTLALRLNDKE